MNQKSLAYIKDMERWLELTLHGETTEFPDLTGCPEELLGLGEKLGRLAGDLAESQKFTRSIASGNLDADPPKRKNFIASPIKEIHSQLCSFNWSIRELVQGRMVSKLFYSGEIYESYNRLVEKIAISFSQVGEPQEGDWDGQVNSWRYHQILSALNHLHIMIIETNACGKVIFANPPARELLQNAYSLVANTPESPLVRYLRTFIHDDPDPLPIKPDNSEYPVFHELHFNDGTWYKITTDCIRLTDGNYGYLHMIDNISEWKRYEQRLTISATIDSLTGAFNRETGMMMLEELVYQGHKETNCIAFIDLDNLKPINDNYGHGQGDYALRSLVKALNETIRETDSVIRYGGDEFIVIFRKCDEASANRVMNRISELIDGEAGEGDGSLPISFSFGIAQITKNIKTATDLVSIADERMYRHKMTKKASLSI